MTLRAVLFETGPDGAGLTNANSGSSTSSIGAGGSTTFAAATKAQGVFGALFANAAGANAFRRWLFEGGATASTWQFSGVLTVPAVAPAANMAIASFVTAAGVARFSVLLNSSMNLLIAGSGSSSISPIATALTPGSKVRVSLQVQGGSTTASVVTAKVYSGTTSWLTQLGSTFNSSAFNTGVDQLVGVDLGVVTATANSLGVGWDSIQINDGTGTEIGDYVPPLAQPVVTIAAVMPPSQVGGSNGSIMVTWPAVPGAAKYEAAIEPGSVSSGFVADDTNATSPHVFSGLTAGEYTVAVRAVVA